ncbi:MAG: hypothetical protein AB1690_08510 [Candidatus Zixiibacteriota bacterium]
MLKKIILVGIGIGLFFTFLALAVTGGDAVAPAAPTAPATGLPASLDAFYPPASAMPAYLFAMHEMSTPLSGIMVDLQQNDPEKAARNYDRFKSQYAKVAAMVPEWQERFPSEPVEKLGRALQSGKMEEVFGAMEALGKSCNGCHQIYMPMAQHKFHWGDFSSVSAQDPLSGEEVSFSQLMLMMESNMTGIGIDLTEGEIENARQNLAGFEARFNAMAHTCQACHETERKYYVSQDITSAFGELRGLLSADPVDPGAVGGKLRMLGQESCSKCHLVHIPAAYAQTVLRAASAK